METIIIVGMASPISEGQTAYFGASIKFFTNQELAQSYIDYLTGSINKYPAGYVPFSVENVITDALDINALLIADAKAKLTAEEIALLNITV